MLTLFALAYAGIAYWYFRLTLQHCREYDTPGTLVLNAALALTVGPCLLVPALIYGFLSGQIPPALRPMVDRG